MDDINMKLDLKTTNSENKYATITQKNTNNNNINNGSAIQNISEINRHSNKFKFNESRSIMKSNLMAVDSLLNFKIG